MQSVSSRIWTRVVVSISYDGNHYPTGTSNACTELMHVSICKSANTIASKKQHSTKEQFVLQTTSYLTNNPSKTSKTCAALDNLKDGNFIINYLNFVMCGNYSVLCLNSFLVVFFIKVLLFFERFCWRITWNLRIIDFSVRVDGACS